MTVRATLPDLNTLDAAALRAFILTQHDEVLHHLEQLASKDEDLVRKDEQLASRDRVIASHAAEIERLKLLILKLQRMQFGRRSEKLGRQIEQLELQLEELEAAQAEVPAVSSAAADAAQVEQVRPARGPLPAHLPREEKRMLPKETACPECGGALKPLGEDVSEMLEWIPAQVKVIRQVRPKLACARCDKIVQAEAPSRPIARGMAGPGLLAHVMASKYCDHLPLYRQSEIYARTGIELDRATLADWVGAASELMEPLTEALRQYVMTAEKLHADDTPVPVLQPGLGKTKTGEAAKGSCHP